MFRNGDWGKASVSGPPGHPPGLSRMEAGQRDWNFQEEADEGSRGKRECFQQAFVP